MLPVCSAEHTFRTHVARAQYYVIICNFLSVGVGGVSFGIVCHEPPSCPKNHNMALARESQHPGIATWWINGKTYSEWQRPGPSPLLWIHGKRQYFGRTVPFRGTHNLHFCSRSREECPLARSSFCCLSPWSTIDYYIL